MADFIVYLWYLSLFYEIYSSWDCTFNSIYSLLDHLLDTVAIFKLVPQISMNVRDIVASRLVMILLEKYGCPKKSVRKSFPHFSMHILCKNSTKESWNTSEAKMFSKKTKKHVSPMVLNIKYFQNLSFHYEVASEHPYTNSNRTICTKNIGMKHVRVLFLQMLPP